MNNSHRHIQIYQINKSEVTCGQVWCPILGICALHLTHPSAKTQQWTHARTHAHMHTHARTHAHMHTHARTHAHARTNARTHARTHAHTHARMHAHMRTRTHAHTHTHARTHARTHTCAHTRTHARTHTHTPWTQTRSIEQPYCYGGAVGGSVPCSRVSPQSWYWRWRESAGYSLPPPTIPAWPEIRTRDLRVTSQTLYPLGHDCPIK